MLFLWLGDHLLWRSPASLPVGVSSISLPLLTVPEFWGASLEGWLAKLKCGWCSFRVSLGGAYGTAVPCAAVVMIVSPHSLHTVFPHVQVYGEVEWHQPRLGRELSLPEGSDYGLHLPALVLVRTVESVPSQSC